MRRRLRGLSSKVYELAAHFGVKLADRNAWRSHRYDGKSIALWGRKMAPGSLRYDDLELSDHEILHEIAHFVVAAPCQRDLPEYGLGYVGGLGELPCEDVVDDLGFSHTMAFDTAEGQIQEHMAQFLCWRWGVAYGLSVYMSEYPNFADSWDQYIATKLREYDDKDFVEKVHQYRWMALFRLDAMGLLRELPISV
jgi:hypothetical protein